MVSYCPYHQEWAYILKHYYPTAKQMRDINREECMTSKNEWDPSKLDDTEGAAEWLIQTFPTPIVATDSFYDLQGNVCAKKSDFGVSDALNISSGNTREGYRSKPRKEKKKKKWKWVTNKKVKWKDQMKAPSFPTHLLPSPKRDSQIKGVPAAVAVELQSYVDQAQVQGTQQIDNCVYYNSNSDDDEDDNDTFHDVIQVEDVIEDTNNDDANIYGEPINNEFLPPAGQQDGTTGVTIEHEEVLYAQYYYYGELYYQSCEIYGDDPAETKEAIDRMAHFSESWSLCDNAPSFQDNPMLCLRSEMEYNQRVIEMNQQLDY